MQIPKADYRDCLELAGDIAGAVQNYGGDDLIEQIVPSLQPVIGELEQLRKWVDDLQSGMYVNCVYCGHRYGPGETTPVSMADALKEHVQQCPKHPMSELRKENAGLRGEAADANLRLLRLRQEIEKIVEPEGIDAGVILLSDDSPTHWSDEHKCHVYEHENFSPLGDALVALWKLAAGKSQPATSSV